jgi:hypothetical protein
MQRRFLTYSLLFFIPIVLAYAAIEWFTNKIPSTYSVNQKYIEKENQNIETLILGSSHLMNAVNAEWMDSTTLNLASGNQHFDTDFKLFEEINPKFPGLKNIVLEVSYSHFEMPINGKDFWKNSLYYKYYDVNCFERTAYFKDRLIFLSNPTFFSERIEEYYIDKKNIPTFNTFGFNSNDSYGQFNAQDYNKEKIDSLKRFRINTESNVKLFQKNITLFFEFLDTLKQRNKNIVICTTPMYSTYLQKRNPEILKRRDSIFELIQKKYPEIIFLNVEADTTHYSLKNFWNHSHLNPSGAKVFTKQLDSVIKTFK